jgi:hypothetical protein
MLEYARHRHGVQLHEITIDQPLETFSETDDLLAARQCGPYRGAYGRIHPGTVSTTGQYPDLSHQFPL